MNELEQQVYRYRIGVSADTKKKISDIGSAEKTCIGYALIFFFFFKFLGSQAISGCMYWLFYINFYHASGYATVR